jgi:hypothetical protein
MNDCTMRVQVDRHFAGTISPEAERSMREHVPACDSCRDLYRRHLLLGRLDPKALSPDERIARGLGLRTRPKVVAMRLGVVTAAAAAAALLLRVHPAADGFSSRGNIGALSPRACRVFVYDVHSGSPPAPAGSVLQNGDELAFAYENGAAKRRLAVFGVDEHAHVYWFHPAWTREADDPVAIPIELDDKRHELPEAVLQRFDGERLEIRSVFVDEPISVRQIEALVRRNPQGALPLPGAVETSLTLAVTP